MDDGFFRKKSMEKVSSPEQLTDYIRVTNPGVWLVLAAVVVLLAGACVWGAFGQLQTRLPVAAVSYDGVFVCYVKEADIGSVKLGMNVVCGDKEFPIETISAQPVTVDEDNLTEYSLHVGNLQVGEWVYILLLDGYIENGAYAGHIVTNVESPMSFIFN